MRNASIRARCRTIVQRSGATALAVLILVGLTAHASLAQGDAPDEAKVIFAELNDSGITGFATLTADGNQTVVRIQAEGALGNHPTHIHQGQCEDLDPNPEIPLTNVQLPPTGVTGRSETSIDVPLDELLEQDRLILIHKSDADLNTYLACGNIVVGALTDEERALGSDSTAPLPDTGVGLVHPDSSFPIVFWLALSVAGVSAGLWGVRVRQGSRRA